MTGEAVELVRTDVRKALDRLPAQPGLAAAILTGVAERLRREAGWPDLTRSGNPDMSIRVKANWDAIRARNETRRLRR